MYNSKVKYNTVVCYIFFGLLTSLLLGVRERTLAGAQCYILFALLQERKECITVK